VSQLEPVRLDIRIVPYADPVATGLMAAALADLSARYGGDGDSTPVDPAEFTAPAGGFLVAWRDGTPVGCGGWRTYHGAPDIAEVKRMYTVPEARGRGVALALLRANPRLRPLQGRAGGALLREGPVGQPRIGQPRTTLPALMHEVHTFRRLVVPPPAGTRTVWMFGFQRRGVRRCEWDTLWPKPGLLPQTSHTLATEVSWVCLFSPLRVTSPGNRTSVPDRHRREPITPVVRGSQ
jgi:GNAT superfamily N-acetyltransferase